MAININAVHLLHPTEKKNGCPTMHRHYSCNNSHFITWVMVWNSLAIKARERKQERGKKSQREITESKKERRQGRAGRGRRRNRGKQKKKQRKNQGKTGEANVRETERSIGQLTHEHQPRLWLHHYPEQTDAKEDRGVNAESPESKGKLKQRRGSSVGGTALPHCHLRLQLQAAGSRNQGDLFFFKNRGKEKTRGREPEETVGT